MATTHAAYYNIMTAEADSRADSRRASTVSVKTTSSTASNKSRLSLKAALEQLKPTTETITPSGIYTPIVKRGSLFQFLKPAEKKQEATPIYSGLSQRDRPLFGRKKNFKRNSQVSA